jgi:photosystem II stability/assembly factor-like uncharacterized protein
MNHITPLLPRKLPSTAHSVVIFLLLLISNDNCAQAWQFLTPIKTNSEIRGCSFLDDQRGIAVTLADGIVFNTTNGGDSWEKMWTPTVFGNPYGIEWVNDNLLFIAASNGDLYRSLDGGNSWTNANPPTNEWLYNVHFINDVVGFATGFNGTILKTSDGGNSWSIIPSGTTNRLYGVHFTDESNGCIVGWNGTILRTTDGGNSWSVITTTITASLQDVHFTDANTGFACGGVIAKTTDGGQTWNTVYSAANSYFNVIHVNANNQGYAAGNMGVLVKTTNAGQTWTAQPAIGTGDVLCGDHTSSGSAYLMGKLQIHKSTNEGSTWTVIKNAAPGGVINAMQFSSDIAGTAVSTPIGGTNYGGIAQTTDGGRLWDIRQTATSGGWYAVDFPTAQVGYVLGTTSLGKTTNGGLNWTFSSPTTITAACIEFLDAQTGFIGGFGSASNICKTTNGGTSFTCGTNIGASAIHFFDDQKGMAIRSVQSGGDTYRKTFDGGNTWEYHNGVIGGCIHFLNDSVGWVGSFDGVYRTLDGAETWEFFFSGTGTVLDIKFYDANIGFCVDNYANLYRSADGGATWEVILQNNLASFGAVSAHFTENYCYIGSTWGEIYRTELGCGTFQLSNITGTQQWCEGTDGQLVCDQIVGASSYEWQLPTGWSGAENDWVIQPTPSSMGGLASVTVTNACGLTDSVSISLSVTPRVDSLLTITGPATLCAGDTGYYSVPLDPNADAYHWQTSSTLSTISNNSISIVAEGNSLYLNVQSENTCGSSNIIATNIAIPINTSHPANFNGDCQINALDMEQLLLHFGCISTCGSFDLSGDGTVGVDDLLLFIEADAAQ